MTQKVKMFYYFEGSANCYRDFLGRPSLRPSFKYSTETKVEEVKELPWSLASAVCIERIPLLSPAVTPLQAKMLETLQQVEFEQSKKCAHEMRHEEDL